MVLTHLGISQGATFSIDTRTLQPGEIFIALEGKRHGTNFVNDAFARGAKACIVPSFFPFSEENEPKLIRVPCTMNALTELGQRARKNFSAPLVAVTGSCGKTTTKNWLVHMLAGEGAYSEKSFNNHIGVPLSLTKLRHTHAWGVFEVGMNHAGEIFDLGKILQPHLSILTNIGPAHIGHLGSLEAIAKEKSSLFDATRDRAIFSSMDEFYPLLVQKSSHLSAYTYGTRAKDTLRVLGKSKISLGGKVYTLPSPKGFMLDLSMGVHQNILACLLAIYALGQDLTMAIEKIRTIQLPDGRGNELLIGKNITVINDAYNANPLSMMLSLKNFSQRNIVGRKVAVIGEMYELGAFSEEYHKKLLPFFSFFDKVFCVGNIFRRLSLPPHVVCCNVCDISSLYQPQNNDVILLKGSRASGLDIYLTALTKDAPIQ